MGYVTSYAGLKADLLQDADDYSADFMAHLDTIIGEAESKCLRDLNLEIFSDEVTFGALTAGTRTLARPASLIKINALWLLSGAARKFIPRRTKGYCDTYAEDPTVEGLPTYYADQSETELYFVDTPDAAYQAIAWGIVRPAGLSETNPTSWLGTNAGDLLFMAAKIRSEEYLVNPNKASMWKDDYNNDLLPRAKLELAGMTRSSYELPKVVAPATQVL